MEKTYLLILLFAFMGCQVGDNVVPLPAAHAHNDYEHEKPLLDALKVGFTSIEADVLLIDRVLYVGHDYPSNGHQLPTLVETYLNPLDSIVSKNNGQVYPGYDGTFYLMLDIKTDAEATYEQINTQLQPYWSWIRTMKAETGKVVIFLSGNRPMETVRNDSDRLVSLDGRPEDLEKGYSPELMPVISQNYSLYSSWEGIKGEMPADEQEKIKELAKRVHQQGKKFRLWGHPDNPNTWGSLQSLGVDFINSDDLKGLQRFLLQE